ncbi:DUF916 and DUF3324 domain-containing protein [Enterococcus sp. DIV0242_7C1]|uniref:Uncharacterized protein n=1 Tax=Candidatus Enterococcus dunnyi TaxID=1834192 RepID=A0A200JDI4_9ENTE|nr:MULTISPECIES: DUF916 and DUF3324 domain-containing protein [unclassified Enterococcus]MBO0471767.1 DUF916 and DUF3324 domain-containing protein [Enterococcus sp. DIV0242_7C1]OUZ34627.1 hypothetical protein A5889_000102 [Enterococcus sp. 9D6_DIV0238]
MKVKTLLILTVFMIIQFLTIGGISTYAKEESKEQTAENSAGATGFTYQVIFPENQNSDSGFFDLRMVPGQKQTVEIALKNPSDKEIKVNAKLTGARTNSNGIIEYGPNKFSADKSMKYEFTDIVKTTESVKIKPKSEENLKLNITMPETEFDGIILGGIQLQRESNDEQAVDNGGTMVINKYAYVIGMRLKETDRELPMDMTFVKAYASSPDFRNTVTIDLGNTQAAVLKDLTVEAQIMGEKSDTVLYESKKNKMRMAPNSILNFQVGMAGEAMKAGNYRAHVIATSGEKRWEWTEKFKITQEEADKFNKEAVGLVQNQGIDWKLIAMIVGGVVVLVAVVFIVIRIVMNKKTKAKKRRKKRKNVQK